MSVINNKIELGRKLYPSELGTIGNSFDEVKKALHHKPYVAGTDITFRPLTRGKNTFNVLQVPIQGEPRAQLIEQLKQDFDIVDEKHKPLKIIFGNLRKRTTLTPEKGLGIISDKVKDTKQALIDKKKPASVEHKKQKILTPKKKANAPIRPEGPVIDVAEPHKETLDKINSLGEKLGFRGVTILPPARGTKQNTSGDFVTIVGIMKDTKLAGVIRKAVTNPTSLIDFPNLSVSLKNWPTIAPIMNEKENNEKVFYFYAKTKAVEVRLNALLEMAEALAVSKETSSPEGNPNKAETRPVENPDKSKGLTDH